MDETSKNILDAVYECRLLVLLESENGKFYQVGLTQDQFQKVSDAIIVEKRNGDNLKPGFDEIDVRINQKWSLDSDLFLGCGSVYTEKEMQSS